MSATSTSRPESRTPRAPHARRRAPAVALALLLVAAVSLAFAASAPSPAPAGPTLADFGWLGGHWQSQGEGHTVEELWLPSRGGMLLGLNRTTTPRGTEFELLRIDERNGTIAYLASPGGRPPVAFALKSLQGQVAEFENPEHDFPKRIRYSRDKDTLTASIHGDDDQSMSWEWTLVTPLK